MGTISLAAAKALLNGSNFAYFGFTGDTSAAAEEEQIQLLKLDATAEDGTQHHLNRADLPQPVTLITNGAATYDAAHKSYVVTPDAQFQHGSVMAATRVDFSKAFKLTFDINVGNDPNGASGTGFVLHNDPAGINALGAAGGGQGLMGIKNGIGITFATDAVTDQTGFVKTSDGSALSAAVGIGDIEDGLWHRVAITSDGQTISYTFDGMQISSLGLATVKTLLGGTSFAYWGFTGATDVLSEQEQVRLVKMEATGADGTAYQIVGPNKDPILVNDAYTVNKNGVLTVSAAAGVLANDYDPDGDPLRVCPESRIVGHALLLAPTNGAVTMNEDGSFTYTPNAGFAGIDSFYYCAEDRPACAQGRVDITVTGTGTPINTILGTSANDVLVGTAGNDLMSGLAGNDRLTGSLGNDTFAFAPGMGNDTITDFSRAVGNRDIIDLSAFHFANADDVLSHALASGADTVFNFGIGDTLTVQNTAAGNITNLLVDDLKLFSATPSVIEAFGSTSLVEVGSNYFLYPAGGSSGPELSYSGTPVVAGQFGSWTPIGAEQTTSGYDVAWKTPFADQYMVWGTDSSGNYISNLTGVVSGTSSALESLEPVFQQDLNGDGSIGPPIPLVIEAFGSTSLVGIGRNYFLYPVGGSSGPELSYSGVPVAAGQFGSWTPIGAEQTANGYDVAWTVPGADQFSVWATDSSGNYTSNILGAVPGTSSELESLEPVFQQDLNGDGSIGLLVQAMASFGPSGTLVNSSGALLGTDPSQQSTLSAPIDQHLAHA
jgi:Ca2+-binding RTX toxin-like protein